MENGCIGISWNNIEQKNDWKDDADDHLDRFSTPIYKATHPAYFSLSFQKCEAISKYNKGEK